MADGLSRLVKILNFIPEAQLELLRKSGIEYKVKRIPGDSYGQGELYVEAERKNEALMIILDATRIRRG